MASIGAMFQHPDEVMAIWRLKRAVKEAQKQIPEQQLHWGFCFSMLHKVSRSFALVIQQLGTQLPNAVGVFYLVLRALDTIEDDMSIATEVKIPILKAFHQHIYNPDWHFPCGTKHYKVLMDEFHHVSTAFLELDTGYQEVIEDITKRMGAGMAKFICKEVETLDDYDEYCHYVAGLVGIGLSKFFHNHASEEMAPDTLSNSMGLLLQKTNIIRDYLEDINEIPKSRMFWPRVIWSKYVNKLEDLKHEENSEKALKCLNEMVTNALFHVEDSLEYLSALRGHAIFRFCAIPQVGLFAMLFLGLFAKVVDQTNSMADVYGAFFDFACMLKLKVDKMDPNATKTLSRIEAIQKICRDSGTLNKRKLYVLKGKSVFTPAAIFAIFIILAVILFRLFSNYPHWSGLLSSV